MIKTCVVPMGKYSVASATDHALNNALRDAGVQLNEVQHIAATGAFKSQVSCAASFLPESLCLSTAVYWLESFSGIILDIGAQKSLAIKCQKGIPTRIERSDKCAAGAGEFLEMVAKVLEIEMDQMADLYQRSKESTEIQSTCAVFAESEIISLIHQKKSPEDILRGVLKGFASRIYSLLLAVGYPDEITLVGGMARNLAVIKAIEEKLNQKIRIMSNPETIGALGAALLWKKQAGVVE